MLQVKTKLDISRIHGIGLFADEFIGKGTIIWKFCPVIDLRFAESEFVNFSHPARIQIEKYSYREKHSRLYVLCGDDARFFNHSSIPNCLDIYSDAGDITFAARDIYQDEELTCDYALFDLDFLEGKYQIPPDNAIPNSLNARIRLNS